MRRRILWLSLIGVTALAGCSEQEVSVSSAHPKEWGSLHRVEASEDPAACTACHGSDLRGGGAVSCYQCHAEGPPFQIHPAAWASPRQDHRGFALTLSWTQCANAICHGADLRGGSVGDAPTGPSCSSASVANEAGGPFACHPGGPPAPHPMPYAAAVLHGPEAKDTQVFCRNCHGQAENVFDGGFAPKGNCSAAACHPAARAHPTDWQGRDDADPGYRATHRTIASTAIAASCALCHNATAAAPGPLAGAPSCLSTTFTNANGNATGCHSQGPGRAPHALPFTDPAQHGPAGRDGMDSCQACHGTPGTTKFDGTPGLAETACSQAGCHPAAGAHPTRWQGADDTDPSFGASHRAVSLEVAPATCGLCHDVTAGRVAPHPDAPSCFARSFLNADGVTTGCHASGPGTTPHDVPYAEPALHGPQAKAGLGFCQNCHGTPGSTEFAGGTAFTACSGCHPDAEAHPTNWQGNNDDASTAHYVSRHTNVALSTLPGSCALCHNTTAAGQGPRPGAPSCLSASFTNALGSTTGCHPGGPGTAAHGEDFGSPAAHGPVAKRDLSFCQTCHGTPGTTLFEGGITGVRCTLCHPAAGAHPTNWQGADDTQATNDYLSTHQTAERIGTACALCHNTQADGAGPQPGAPSCFAADFTNADGAATPCHAGGPGVAPHPPFASPAAHGPAAKQDLGYCQECHGTPGTPGFGGGIVGVACSQAACHPSARAHPTDWQGSNDDAATNGYFSTHRTSESQATACVICHDGPTAGGTTKLAGTPSCFAVSHTNGNGLLSGCHPGGPIIPHPKTFVPLAAGDAVSLAAHGAAARPDLTSCRQCHADPFNGGPGSNPTFNVLLGRLDDGAGHTGCERCHESRTAHPAPWAQGAAAGTAANHGRFGNLAGACTLCHGANLLGTAPADNGVGPGCTACHNAGLPVRLAGGPAALLHCTSCHNVPPNGLAPAGNARPNREGAHLEHDALPGVTPQAGQTLNCTAACHNDTGAGTASHFDLQEPASVAISATYDAKSGAAARNADGTCSNVSCHGGVTTPTWAAGALDVGNRCEDCHVRDTTFPAPAAPGPQHNSPYSGQHNRSAHVLAMNFYASLAGTSRCRMCHDAAKLEPAAQKHFGGLGTPTVFETDPATTLRDQVQYVGGSCNPDAGGASAEFDALPCHGDKGW